MNGTSREDDSSVLLRIESLCASTREGVSILRDLSFDVRRGERVALVGANGAGKTTTLRCVARLFDSWSGQILLSGVSVRSFSRRELARKIAVVRQISDAFGTFSARQIVATGRLPYLAPFERLSKLDVFIVEDALRRVDALQFADRRLDSLSGGERQKILVAAAFAQQPELLLLDEPTTFLDYRNQSEITDAVALWLDDANATALETTHDLNRAALIADRVVALREGASVFVGEGRKTTSSETLQAIFDVQLTTAPHPSTRTPMIVPDAPKKRNEATSPPNPHELTFPSTRPRARHATSWAVVLTFATVAALFLFPLLGRTVYPFDVWFQFPTSERPLVDLDAHARIFWGERLPKTLLASLAGASLALAGLTLQTLFRNALATPYTLGIAGGASFGASSALHFSGLFAALGLPGALLGAPLFVWFAGLGACVSTSLVYALSRRARTPERALLAGVVVGFFFSSLVLCEQYLANPTQTFAALRWTIGGLDFCEPGSLWIASTSLVFSAASLLYYARELDVSTLGDDRARALGVDVDKLRRTLFLVSSILVGVVVAFCGPIGFVGLIVPHGARLFVGSEIRKLAPASILAGALFLSGCYTAARIAFFPGVLPVGIVTSLLGGPFFLWALLRRKDV